MMTAEFSAYYTSLTWSL